MRCDGSIIPEPSIWHGIPSPNLNGEGLFLRGGSDLQVLDREDDQIQDHVHADSGHGHGNDGHSHVFGDYYSVFSGSGTGDCLWPDGSGQCVHYEHGSSVLNNLVYDSRTSGSAYVEIHKSTSGVGGVESGYRKGDETRPKNMKVVYIIKIF